LSTGYTNNFTNSAGLSLICRA